ncbi:MAG: RidA family protein [Bacteroidota bacterium]
MNRPIRTDRAPAAIGPYSQGIIAGGTLVFTAGQIPLDPSSGTVEGPDIRSQTRRVLMNLQGVLEGAGSGLSLVVKTTVFLKDMNDFSAMNEVYAEFFPGTPPARTTVEVSRLPREVRVEIEAVATLPPK